MTVKREPCVFIAEGTCSPRGPGLRVRGGVARTPALHDKAERGGMRMKVVFL
jgi:hypothetical protein